MRGVFAVAGRLTDERVVVDQLARIVAAVRQLPRCHVRRGVILDVLHIAAALEHQRLEAVVTKLLRGPTAGNSGADDDGVVRLIGSCHGRNASSSVSVCAVAPKRTSRAASNRWGSLMRARRAMTRRATSG